MKLLGSTFLAPTLVQVKFYRNARTAANISLHNVFNSYQMVWLCDGLEHQLCIATIKLWYKIAAGAIVTYTAPTQILAFLTYIVIVIILIQIRILLRL